MLDIQTKEQRLPQQEGAAACSHNAQLTRWYAFGVQLGLALQLFDLNFRSSGKGPRRADTAFDYHEGSELRVSWQFAQHSMDNGLGVMSRRACETSRSS